MQCWKYQCLRHGRTCGRESVLPAMCILYITNNVFIYIIRLYDLLLSSLLGPFHTPTYDTLLKVHKLRKAYIDEQGTFHIHVYGNPVQYMPLKEIQEELPYRRLWTLFRLRLNLVDLVPLCDHTRDGCASLIRCLNPHEKYTDILISD